MSTTERSTTALRTLRIAAWTVGVVVALAQMYKYRAWVNADSTSYLDMSDAVTTGEWSRLVNATWSPMYPALIGVLRLFSRSPAWDFPAAHVALFISFLFAFACFERLLAALLDATSAPRDGLEPIPVWIRTAVAYALFLCASLGMLSLMKPTPDMLMSAFLLLAVTLLVRIRHGHDDTRSFAALGLVLGLGYLAKAFMFPLGVVMIGMTLLFGGGIGRRLSRAAMAAVVMLVIAAPFVIAVSRLAHHPTIGDAGKVVHLVYVDGAGPPPLWTNPGQATGQFTNPPRQIFSSPNAYVFPPWPIPVTRSVWYDPALGTDGVKPGFRMSSQLAAIRASLLVYGTVVLECVGVLIAIILLAIAAGGRRTRDALLAHWPVWMTAVVAFGAYGIIHVESRYIGTFVALFWMGLGFGFRMSRTAPMTLVRGLSVAVMLNLAAVTLRYMYRDYQENSDKTRIGDLEAGVALNALGVGAGSRVARINSSVADGWARLARVSIVAEVQRSHANDFWKAAPDVQRNVLAAFAGANVRTVVGHLPERRGALPSGWTRLGASEYAVYMLPAPGGG